MAYGLEPNAWLLAGAVALDLAIGDPEYRWHPVRLIGGSLTAIEKALRRMGFDGYGGGVGLFLLLSTVWVGAISGVVVLLGKAAHFFFLYSLLALGDLLRHGWRVEKAVRRDDIDGARKAIGWLVGRDTSKMDGAACRRAALESLSENLTDGFLSPLFFYAIAGIPGLVLFKVVSTMDSMVGYKNERYLRFGWCGARTDDLLNWIPARLSWLMISVIALFIPGCSMAKGLRVGWRQHQIVPGPNSGWSEATLAGAIRRRLIGPIWQGGRLVTEVWLGDAADAEASTASDYVRGSVLVALTGLVAAAMVCAAIV